jgi:hypothetical protein
MTKTFPFIMFLGVAALLLIPMLTSSLKKRKDSWCRRGGNQGPQAGEPVCYLAFMGLSVILCNVGTGNFQFKLVLIS